MNTAECDRLCIRKGTDYSYGEIWALDGWSRRCRGASLGVAADAVMTCRVVLVSNSLIVEASQAC